MCLIYPQVKVKFTSNSPEYVPQYIIQWAQHGQPHFVAKRRIQQGSHDCCFGNGQHCKMLQFYSVSDIGLFSFSMECTTTKYMIFCGLFHRRNRYSKNKWTWSLECVVLQMHPEFLTCYIDQNLITVQSVTLHMHCYVTLSNVF